MVVDPFARSYPNELQVAPGLSDQVTCDIVETNGILIVNLSQITDKSLGAQQVYQIWRVMQESRESSGWNDFYLYIDGVQDFIHAEFGRMVAEAEKVGLNLILSNQHISQLEDNIADALLGNMGNVMCFRIGPRDAPIFSRLLSGQFIQEKQLAELEAKLSNLNNHVGFCRRLVNGQPDSIGEVAVTVNLPKLTSPSIGVFVPPKSVTPEAYQSPLSPTPYRHPLQRPVPPPRRAPQAFPTSIPSQQKSQTRLWAGLGIAGFALLCVLICAVILFANSSLILSAVSPQLSQTHTSQPRIAPNVAPVVITVVTTATVALRGCLKSPYLSRASRFVIR